MLSGNYKGFMECHVEDNFLLIWIDETSDVIKLVRLGTHHELFGKFWLSVFVLCLFVLALLFLKTTLILLSGEVDNDGWFS